VTGLEIAILNWLANPTSVIRCPVYHSVDNSRFAPNAAIEDFGDILIGFIVTNHKPRMVAVHARAWVCK
jgi:hypothetical protein